MVEGAHTEIRVWQVSWHVTSVVSCVELQQTKSNCARSILDRLITVEIDCNSSVRQLAQHACRTSELEKPPHGWM